MALATNQHGYDVVSADNERISVKTVTTSNHVSFRKSTHHHVDRVIVLRLNVEENEASIEELLDCGIDTLSEHVVESETDLTFRLRGKLREPLPIDDLAIAAEAVVGSMRVIQYESGTIAIEANGRPLAPVLPILKQIAAEIGVSQLNSAGGARNTRQLGAVSLMRTRLSSMERDLGGQGPSSPGIATQPGRLSGVV